MVWFSFLTLAKKDWKTQSFFTLLKLYSSHAFANNPDIYKTTRNQRLKDNTMNAKET